MWWCPPWLWPRACYCCSAWRWSAAAGTSPSDAPRDRPDPVLCSSLWGREGQKMINVAAVHVVIMDIFVRLGYEWVIPDWMILNRPIFCNDCRACVGVWLILPRLLSLDAGAVVGQGHSPGHFRVSSFPVRHACCSSLHCNAATRINIRATR